jgi:hypothetical protein
MMQAGARTALPPMHKPLGDLCPFSCKWRMTWSVGLPNAPHPRIKSHSGILMRMSLMSPPDSAGSTLIIDMEKSRRSSCVHVTRASTRAQATRSTCRAAHKPSRHSST